MTWTLFWDMHSGGGCKEPPYEKIYIEAPEDEARVIFYNRFSHSPDRVTCTCCGNDYSVSSSETLEEATEFHRKPLPLSSIPRDEQPLDLYILKAEVLVIPSSDITPAQREGTVPEQGYVWCD